jgi:hypothetical protein
MHGRIAYQRCTFGFLYAASQKFSSADFRPRLPRLTSMIAKSAAVADLSEDTTMPSAKPRKFRLGRGVGRA